MNVTVAICTWNRAALLDRALASLQALEIPAGLEWELLVVDNNSTDATQEVLKRHQEALPLRCLFEPAAGKSHALNRATREASGDYIVWTDDDIRADAGWLAAYVRAFDAFPQAVLFGGPVSPWFEGDPPAWVRRVLPQIEGAYAMRDLGADPIPFTQEQIPYGVNMAIRTREQRRYLYDTELGPRPGSPLRREDAMLARQILADGLEGRWVPAARIHHFIPRARQTLRYLRDYYSGEGEYYAIMDDGDGPRFFGRPRWVWREALEAELRYRLRRLLAEPEEWIQDLKRASVARGRLRTPAGAH